HDLYEGLVVFGADGVLAGGSARSWDVSSDGKTYTFHLRPGLRWSNGDPLGAEDFVYSFLRLVDPSTKSPYAFTASPIRNASELAAGKGRRVEEIGVEAVRPDVVRITLNAPTPYFLAALTNACFEPVSTAAVERSAGSLDEPRTAITNGPYVLDAWFRGRA